jgi:hypothetical protein
MGGGRWRDIGDLAAHVAWLALFRSQFARPGDRRRCGFVEKHSASILIPAVQPPPCDRANAHQRVNAEEEGRLSADSRKGKTTQRKQVPYTGQRTGSKSKGRA